MKILIVDDDASIAFLLSEILKIWGHDVSTLNSPLEAVEQLQKDNTYDIVFTDFVMDDMTGKDLIDEVKKTQPELHFVITTALPKEKVIGDTGIEHILEKPFKMDNVKQILEKLPL